MSIDKYQQSMENWKKEIIIDPHLNALFDSELSAEDFLNQKIKCLGHEDMIKVYMKLTSLKHSISKNMQKQIQTKHSSIEYSFEECLKSKQIYESVNQDELKQNLKQIQKCNEKYEFIAERVIELKNINKVLHFAKALQKLKVNVRLLKSLMKDFDQNNNNHLQIELLNTLKISKIIKQIAQITLKFDFSGIKSFEEARHFINSTRGSIFGLIEKQLNSIFSKLANKQQTKRAELQKDIVNNFIVLNNINKLKDYCIPFFKGILKQTSQLLKKSISIGQLNEQKDLKKNLVGFWQFFSNQVSKKIIQNSYIFVVYDESLRKMSSSPFNFNFLQKYWQNIVSFMKDLINWSIQNDSKEWRKQKTSESLYQAFRIVGEKRILNKFLTSIIWKYPILFKVLSQIGNQVHIHVIKYSQFISYNFSTIKEKLVLTLLPLAQLYYKHANLFFQALGNNLQKICSDISNEAGNNLNQHLNRLLQLLSETRTNKNVIYIEQWVTIMEWLVYSVQTEQISEYLATKSLQICQQSCNVISQAVKSNFNEHKQLLGGLIQKIRIYINKVKIVLTQKLYKQKSNEKTQNKFTLHSFAPNSQQMVIIIRRFSQHKQLLQQSKKLIEQNSI